jgi:hypothetical protein
MENFILWNAAVQDDGRTLSFTAFAMAVKQLHQGTREMVEQMLRDLGVPDIAFTSWRVGHFVTNYLADDLDSDEWEDVWNDNWRVDVQLATPLKRTWSDLELIRTYASDASWTGEPPEPPFECVVVADFLEADALTHAEAVLRRLEEVRTGTLTPDELRREVPTARPALSSEVAEELRAWPDARVGVERRAAEPARLVISVGRFGVDFFEDGAPLAEKVRELCRVLGGLTTWNDLTDSQV